MLSQKETHEDVIEAVDKHMLSVLLNDVDHIVVFFYDTEECEAETKRRAKAKQVKDAKKKDGKKDEKEDDDDEDICEKILHELEHIDDNCDEEGIHFVSLPVCNSCCW